MPYRSPEQARLMRAVAHNPGFAKKVGISQSVGKKFEADKAGGDEMKKRYEEGGEVDPLEEANKGENLDTTPGPKAEREVEKPKPKPRAKVSPPASKPVTKAAAPSPAPAPTRAKSDEYTGLPTAAERMSEIRKRLSEAEAENVRKRNERAESSKKSLSDFMTGVKRRFGTQAMREEASKSYAKGGSVRGDGCAQRGHTKGKMR